MKILTLLCLLCFCLNCGVKKPPLPPLAETPQKADDIEKVKKKLEEESNKKK